MAFTPQSPRTVDDWLKELDRFPLPVPAEALEQVRRALTDNRRTRRDIAEMILRTPTLALAVMREANQSAAGLDAPVETLEAALTRLGLSPIAQLLNRLPRRTADKFSLPFLQVQAISQHAMVQAQGMFGDRLARLGPEIALGSLLFLAPLWAVVYAHPELFEEWERRIQLQPRQSERQIEEELLGVPLVELCQQVATVWNLQEWIIRGWWLLGSDRRLLVKALHIARDFEHPLQQQHRLDEDLPLRRWVTQPSNTLLLANGVAVAAFQHWRGPHMLRWQWLAGLYLQMPLPQVKALNHQQAAISARLYGRREVRHPAEALIWPGASPNLAQAPVTAPTRPSVEPGIISDEWRRLCGELLRQPSPFANAGQLLGLAREALLAAGLPRFALFTYRPSHNSLQLRAASGLDGQPDLQLDSRQALMTKLLRAPLQLVIDAGNAARIQPHLPEALRRVFPEIPLYLRSLAADGRVGVLLVGDCFGTAIDAIHLDVLSKTCACIERALALATPR